MRHPIFIMTRYTKFLPRERMRLGKVRLSQDQARDYPSVSIEHQLKPQAMPSRLGGAHSGPTEWLCRVLRGFVSFQRVLIQAQSVCPILAQIDCFKRAPVPSLEEPCSDSRGVSGSSSRREPALAPYPSVAKMGHVPGRMGTPRT